RSEQGDDCRLGPLQTKRRSEIVVRSDPFEVLVPGLPRIGAQLLLRSAEQQVPGAFDVIGGEGMAVVPFDALAQPERQFSAVFVPRPIGGCVLQAASLASLGRIAEAKASAQRLLSLEPKFSVGSFVAVKFTSAERLGMLA